MHFATNERTNRENVRKNVFQPPLSLIQHMLCGFVCFFQTWRSGFVRLRCTGALFGDIVSIFPRKHNHKHKFKPKLRSSVSHCTQHKPEQHHPPSSSSIHFHIYIKSNQNQNQKCSSQTSPSTSCGSAQRAVSYLQKRKRETRRLSRRRVQDVDAK